MSESHTIERCKNAALALGWTYPFFLVPMGKIEKWEETKDVNSMGISLSGVIKVNPDYIKKLSDQELAGVVFHELFHPMLGHHERRGSREPRRWNRAADRALNQALADMGVKMPKGCLFPERGDEKLTAEELYDKEPPDPTDEDPDYQPQAGAGCGPEDDNGNGGGDQGQGDQGQGGQDPGAPQMSQDQANREWAQAAAQAQALAAGTGAAEVLARIFKAPRPRTKIEQILKGAAAQALSLHGRDAQTWAKRSRRSPAGGYLPGWTATQATLAFVIDSSGSVSDGEVEHLVGVAMRLVQAQPGLRIFLALHASACYFSGWIQAKRDEDIASRITDRGGTDFTEAYQRVEECGKRIDVMVHGTDGECWGAWPAKPRNVSKMVVALTRGESCQPPEGAIIIPSEV